MQLLKEFGGDGACLSFTSKISISVESIRCIKRKIWAGKSLHQYHRPRPRRVSFITEAPLRFKDATLPLMGLSAGLERSTEGHTNHVLSAPGAASCGAEDKEVSRSP